MPYVIDLSGTPYEEDCAQIGRDPIATERSHEEAKAYRAAIIAVCGPPPEGYALRINPNAHDFGTYYTVQLQCPDEDGQEGRTYEALVEQGIDQWNAAMMPAPYAYHPNGSWTALDGPSPAGAAIESALVASRPNSAGRFDVPLFQQIHERLRAAYPVEAVRADARIALIASTDPVAPQ
jgi:hypothetical protein